MQDPVSREAATVAIAYTVEFILIFNKIKTDS